MTDNRVKDPTEVQFFLDQLGTERMFSVIFIKKSTGEQRQLTGWLEPSDQKKNAVPMRVATEDPDEKMYRSFCKDHVLSIQEVI